MGSVMPNDGGVMIFSHVKLWYVRFLLIYTVLVISVSAVCAIAHPTERIPPWFWYTFLGWLASFIPLIVYAIVVLWIVIGEEFGN
jgi:hypothetical protein